MNHVFCYFVACLLLLTSNHLLASDQPETQQPTRSEQLLEQLYAPNHSEVFVVAHRGVWRDFPENSLAAIQQAYALGVQMVELDIRQTKDGHLILMHDKTLDRTTTGTGRVSHHTLEEIKALRLLNGYGVPTEETVPTLREALQVTHGQMLVYLDKSYELIPEAFAIAKQLDMQDEVFFYGHVTAKQLQAEYPDLHKELNYLPKLNPSIKDRRTYIKGFLDRERSPAFVVSFKQDDAAFFKDLEWIRASGKRIWASPLWPGMCGDRTDDRAMVDADANWGWLLEQGFSLICTDRPRDLLTYLDTHEKREQQVTVEAEH